MKIADGAGGEQGKVHAYRALVTVFGKLTVVTDHLYWNWLAAK